MTVVFFQRFQYNALLILASNVLVRNLLIILLRNPCLSCCFQDSPLVFVFESLIIMCLGIDLFDELFEFVSWKFVELLGCLYSCLSPI